MRKHYIDNLRILCIFLLFPFHASMCYVDYGGPCFYVQIAEVRPLTMICNAVYPWWMSLLFALAGLSTMYALKKRGAGKYAKERVLRLLLPLLAGIALNVPVQSYIADVYFNGYSGNYFEHYGVFFTKLTDLTGYDGGFTPGHLWFILYLFVFSMLFLPLTAWYAKKEKKPDADKLPSAVLYAVPPVLLMATNFILELGGKSLGSFSCCFLLGFFILSDDKIQQRIKKHTLPLTIVWIALMIIRCTMYAFGCSGFAADVIYYIGYHTLEWVGICAAIGLGQRFLNRDSAFTRYFAPASFPIFILHQSILCAVALGVARLALNDYLGFALVTVASFVATVAVYEVIRHIPYVRNLIGMKRKDVERRKESAA